MSRPALSPLIPPAERPQIDLRRIARPDVRGAELKTFAWSVVLGARVPGPFAEIGVRHANSTRCVLDVLSAIGHARTLYSVDVDPGARGQHASAVGGRSDGSRSIFVLGSSRDARTRESVPDGLAWLLIDGCHCAGCALSDVETWGPKLADGGILVLHDTASGLGTRAQEFCHASGKVELARVCDAIERSTFLRDECALLAAEEDPPLLGIRVYRRKP